MTAAARFTQADLTRAMKSAKSAGVRLSKILIMPNGCIEMQFGGEPIKSGAKSSWDDLLEGR